MPHNYKIFFTPVTFQQDLLLAPILPSFARTLFLVFSASFVKPLKNKAKLPSSLRFQEKSDVSVYFLPHKKMVQLITSYIYLHVQMVVCQ